MHRILFVDDDARVLDRYSRAAAPWKGWKASTAQGLQNALEALNEQDFSVVVTDVRPQSTDGITLLERVRHHHPEVVRLVCSGTMDERSALQVLPHAHQYVPDIGSLEEVASQAVALRNVLDHKELLERIGAVEGLPSVGAIYREMTIAVGQSATTNTTLAGIVERDPGLCAKLLGLANSAMFGVRNEIRSANHAIGYLGLAMVRDMVLFVDVFSTFEQAGAPAGFSLRAVHSHSVRTARLARRIAKPEAKADAYLSGLLHDVGRMLIACHFPKCYIELSKANLADGPATAAFERALLGASHADLGAYLLSLWGLPTEVVQAVAWHHQSIYGTFDGGAQHALQAADLVLTSLTDDTIDLSQFGEMGEHWVTMAKDEATKPV